VPNLRSLALFVLEIVEGTPDFPGVSRPRPRSLSEILMGTLVGRAKMKMCTNLELPGFTGFGDILEGMPKILEVT